MGKRIRIRAIVLLCVCLNMLFAGCQKEEDPADAKYKIYHINSDGTSLVEAAYHGEMQDTEKAVKDMLDSLKKNEDKIEEQPAIPAGVEVLEYSLKDEKLILNFNQEYHKMDVVQEVLCRAALVRSLDQIEGVDLVAFYVEGEPLTNQKGVEYGYQQAEDYVQNTGSSINSYEEMTLPLYFANSTGDKLIQEDVEVRYDSNQLREKTIVERLMKGPSTPEGKATIPKGTKLLSVSIKDGVCYLNFDEGLKQPQPGVKPETVIYSIVNSVTEKGLVGRVQISINGDNRQMFQESVKLGEPLSRNLDIVEEK